MSGDQTRDPYVGIGTADSLQYYWLARNPPALTKINEEHHGKIDVSEKSYRPMMVRLMFERPYQS